MANPLMSMLGGQMMNANPQMAMIQQFMQFKNSYRGNPKDQVMQMVSNGQISQEQLAQAKEMAKSFSGMVK